MTDRITQRPVRLRLIQPGTGPGAVTVLGRTYAPRADGLGGDHGWQTASHEPKEGDTSLAKVVFANGDGSDGRPHRERFLILTEGRLTPGTGPGAYRPGDEWVEIWQDGLARPVFVGTPIEARVDAKAIELTLADAHWLLARTSEDAAGFWCHAPRDAFEHHTKLWQAVVADDFNDEAYTYSVTPQSTPGGWSYQRAETDPSRPSQVRLRTTSSVAYGAFLARPAMQAGWLYDLQDGGDAHIRLQVTVVLSGLTANPGDQVVVAIGPQGIYVTRDAINIDSDDAALQRIASQGTDNNRRLHLTVEIRGRWTFFYVDGRLVSTHPSPRQVAAQPFIGAVSTSGGEVRADVERCLLRCCRPFALRSADRGDLHLPVGVPAGGLRGTYYDEGQTASTYTPAELRHFALAAGRRPYAQREDLAIQFAAVAPPAWQPKGPAGAFSARWVGAIRLDLTTAVDVAVRLRDLNGAGRVWVARTRIGEQVIDDWPADTDTTRTATSAWLKAGSAASAAPVGDGGPLAGRPTGWYPIIVEYLHPGGTGGVTLEVQRSTAIGVWTVAGPDILSPLGVYEQFVRRESHQAQLKAIRDLFGVQFTCEPRSLESGEFPGRIAPRARVGTDTNHVLEGDNSANPQVTVNASETCDSLLGDAGGLGDDQQRAQLADERVNFAQAAQHLFLHQDYEPAPEISNAQLLQRRLDSQLLVRGGPWEETVCQPQHSQPRLVEAYPVTGALARLAWEPGDGARLHHPKLGVIDHSPRQILALDWSITPNGRVLRAVSFRQRPRGVRQLIDGLVRNQRAQKRSYQGQLVSLAGSQGQSPGTDSVAPVPSVERVYQAVLYVTAKSGGASMAVHVNGVDTGQVVTSVGPVDVTRHVTAPAVAARLAGAADTWQAQLVVVYNL